MGLIGHLLVVVLDVVEAEVLLLILAQCVIFPTSALFKEVMKKAFSSRYLIHSGRFESQNGLVDISLLCVLPIK